ncbi:hypothetical protein ACJX0J_006801, partial [Zea mays]
MEIEMRWRMNGWLQEWSTIGLILSMPRLEEGFFDNIIFQEIFIFLRKISVTKFKREGDKGIVGVSTHVQSCLLVVIDRPAEVMGDDRVAAQWFLYVIRFFFFL